MQAVLTWITFQGDVNPVETIGVVFPYNLVVRQVEYDVLQHFASNGDGGQTDVGSFSFQVLAFCYATYGSVQGGASVTTADADRFSIPLSQGFQNLFTKVPKV